MLLLYISHDGTKLDKMKLNGTYRERMEIEITGEHFLDFLRFMRIRNQATFCVLPHNEVLPPGSNHTIVPDRSNDQFVDAIAAVVVGAVIIISINLKTDATFEAKKDLIKKSGLIAGFGLFIIYAGLIAVGASYGGEIDINSSLNSDMQRANLLTGISIKALGNFGYAVLSVLIALACFTTAVGIVTGTADYFKGLINNSQTVYVVTAIIASVFGVVVGQLDFNTIIVIALPILLFIYPITIVLIILNAIPNKYAPKLVFRIVVLLTFLFSIPDVVGVINPSKNLSSVVNFIPFAKYSLGWVLPSLAGFIIANLLAKKA